MEKIKENGDIVITKLIPNLQTDDEAEWNILIELNKSFQPGQFNLILKNKKMPWLDKIRLYTILILFVIPVVIPVLIYFIKRKFLWVSPFIAFILIMGLTVLFDANFFRDLFDEKVYMGWGYWNIPIRGLVVPIVVTGILYGIDFVKTRKK